MQILLSDFSWYFLSFWAASPRDFAVIGLQRSKTEWLFGARARKCPNKDLDRTAVSSSRLRLFASHCLTVPLCCVFLRLSLISSSLWLSGSRSFIWGNARSWFLRNRLLEDCMTWQNAKTAGIKLPDKVGQLLFFETLEYFMQHSTVLSPRLGIMESQGSGSRRVSFSEDRCVGLEICFSEMIQLRSSTFTPWDIVRPW